MSKLADGWYIQTPGDLRTVVPCDSFEHAMRVYHEGFNLPFQIINGQKEPWDVIYKRVKDFYDQPTTP